MTALRAKPRLATKRSWRAVAGSHSNPKFAFAYINRGNAYSAKGDYDQAIAGTYLVPGDVRETSLQVEATAKRATINENELTNGLQQAPAGIVVAVIDACRNDLFSRAAGRAIGNERGLRPAETEGIFKLYSASEGQTALDCLPGSDGSRNSVFTRVFLKAIGTPGLNLNTLGATVRDEVHELAVWPAMSRHPRSTTS
jgi:hypothetical protein